MSGREGSIEQIRQVAEDAEFAAALAIISAEQPSSDPTLIALNAAHEALKKIKLIAVVDTVTPIDEGGL